MAWAERLAKEFTQRDNPSGQKWYVGEVKSVDPLIVSILEGQVLLQGNNLFVFDELWLCEAHRECIPRNNPPPGCPGCEGCSGCPGLETCYGCKRVNRKGVKEDGYCIRKKPYEVGDKVAVVGDQVFILVSRVTQSDLLPSGEGGRGDAS